MGFVYAIENTENGVAYIGSTMNVSQRWRGHKSDLRHGRHANVHLQNAWNKYGKKVFRFSVLEEVADLNELVGREQNWLNKYRKNGRVYNFGIEASVPTRGYRHTPEARKKIREALLGHPVLEETRLKLSEANKGKRLTEETRQKIGRALRGRALSGEHRHNLSRAGKGRIVSQETRRRLSKSLHGRVLSGKTRRKIGEAHAGPYPAFRHRETGEVIPAGHNLRALCRERGLTRSSMRKVICGKRNHHKGWELTQDYPWRS